MKKQLFTLLTLLLVGISSAWADPTYHSVAANINNTPYEAYQIYDAGTSCVVKKKSSEFNTAFTSWVSGGIYDYGSSTYSIPSGITASNWLTASGKGAKIRDASTNSLVFYVTNCVGVTILGKAAGSADNKKLTLSVKKDDAEVGSLAVSTTTSVHELSYGTALNKNYSYIVTVACSGAQNSELYQIRFEAPAVTTTIGTTGWSTFSSNKALDFAHATPSNPASTDLKAYMITGASGTSITKSDALDNVPGSTGLLINGTAGETYTIPVLASSETSTTGNLMKPCVTATTVNYNDNAGYNYVLMNNSGTPEFQKIVSGTYSSANVGAGKAYLALTEDPGSRALSLFDDETTALQEIQAKGVIENGQFYNLAGQRVAQPTKGLYIVNGKKVIIK